MEQIAEQKMVLDLRRQRKMRRDKKNMLEEMKC